MNAQILIDSLVQQFTVLVAQLATHGGVRTEVAHVANQVFADLARELQAQGVSRKVSADMFGMALRAYQRKLRRLESGDRRRAPTLGKAVLDAIAARGSLGRSELLARWGREDEALVRGLLRDLVDRGQLVATGRGTSTRYRLPNDRELDARATSHDGGLEEWLWAFVYRNGPITAEALAGRLPLAQAQLTERLESLAASGRLARTRKGYVAQDMSVPLASAAGWEAAVFDHLQAVVQAITQRLQRGAGVPKGAELAGGSTYSFDIWDGHPLTAEVEGSLARFRVEQTRLRERVDAWNRDHGRPARYRQVVMYGGQCVLDRETGAGSVVGRSEKRTKEER